MIWEVWLPVVIIYVKNGYCKTRNIGLAGQWRKKTSRSNNKLRFSERSLDLVRGFLFQFGVIWEVRWKMAIVKQGTSDWPGNDLKITSHSNLKLSASKWGVDRSYLRHKSLSVSLLKSKSCLVESVSECESVPRICVQENFHNTYNNDLMIRYIQTKIYVFIYVLHN